VCGWLGGKGIGGEGRRDKLHVSELWEGWVDGKGIRSRMRQLSGFRVVTLLGYGSVCVWGGYGVWGCKIDADTIICPHSDRFVTVMLWLTSGASVGSTLNFTNV
jgi:hypothetical protein